MKKDNLVSALDPSEHGDFSSSIINTIKKAMIGIDGMLPASIVSYSKVTNTATVKIMIDMMTTDGGTLARPILYNIPVYRYGGGGFFIGIDLKEGDNGWLKANDRDITGFLGTLSQSKPSSMRVKNFSDAVFFPDTISTGSMGDGVISLQSLDGSTAFAIAENSIKFKVGGTVMEITPNGVAITTPSVKHNEIEIGATHTNGGMPIP